MKGQRKTFHTWPPVDLFPFLCSSFPYVDVVRAFLNFSSFFGGGGVTDARLRRMSY